MTSKELSLSLLEIEKHLKDFVFELEMGKVDKMFISHSFEIIETALKEYEFMKQTKIIVHDKKISDDDLEKLKNQIIIADNLEQKIEPLFDNETKKKLKALEIIKEKEVNVFVLLHSGNLKIYNDIVEDNRKLTQEKYDLLKEALK